MNTIPVPGRFNCIASDQKLAGAYQIYDDNFCKRQSEINYEVSESIFELQNRDYPTYDPTRECLIFPVGYRVDYDSSRQCVIFY